jgi:hypothetical protein
MLVAWRLTDCALDFIHHVPRHVTTCQVWLLLAGMMPLPQYDAQERSGSRAYQISWGCTHIKLEVPIALITFSLYYTDSPLLVANSRVLPARH